MENLGSIFFGIPPRQSRNFIFKFVSDNKKKFDRFVVPCAGRFAATEVMIRTGIKPENFFCSDISLFSSVLGYFYSKKDVNDLKIKIDLDGFKNMKYTPEQVLFAIKYLQTSDKNEYMKQLKDEIWINKEKYMEDIRVCLEKNTSLLGGLNYEIRDLVDVFNDEVESSNTFIFFNPPAYRGGYTKMFKDVKEKISWGAPHIDEFDAKQRNVLLDSLCDAKATILTYHNLMNVDTYSVPEGWNKLFVKKYSEKRRDYLILNKEYGSKNTVRRKESIARGKFNIWCDSDYLNKFSKVNFVRIPYENAIYYRNLFVHKLSGVLDTKINYGLLIDGNLIGVCGFNTRDQVKDNKGYIWEVYGITITSRRFRRLNRLLMRLMLSYEFRNQLMQDINFGVSEDLRGIKTTCLSRHPEVRLNSGLLKIVNREFLRNKEIYKLQYYSDFYDKSYKQMILEFLEEEKRYKKLKNGEDNTVTGRER